MNWLIDNWFVLLAIAALGAMVGAFIWRFWSMPTQEQTAKVKEWLLWAVTGAEKELGGGGFTGAWMFQSAFTDAAKVNDWAREAVAWCGMNGILEGRGDGSFDPAGKAQRSELAKVLTKYRQISGE